MSEQDNLREAQEEKLRVIKLLEGLESSEGWKYLLLQMKAQVMTRRQIDFGTRIGRLDDAFASATNRAEALGIETTMALPRTLIDEAQIELEQIKARIKEIEDDGNANAG